MRPPPRAPARARALIPEKKFTIFFPSRLERRKRRIQKGFQPKKKQKEAKKSSKERWEKKREFKRKVTLSLWRSSSGRTRRRAAPRGTHGKAFDTCLEEEEEEEEEEEVEESRGFEREIRDAG